MAERLVPQLRKKPLPRVLDIPQLRLRRDNRFPTQFPCSRAPAWHGASPEGIESGGQANPAALTGWKTKEFNGSGHNPLVFDDTDQQLRVQLATTQHASQLNLGHLIHQARYGKTRHRGSFRGLGFELRTDAYGTLRASQGLLISTYGTQQSEPAGDNAAGMALVGQFKAMAQSYSQAAQTHQTVQLASHIGSVKAAQSGLSKTSSWDVHEGGITL
jgi:type VI secretion system secreted protein VgrG